MMSDAGMRPVAMNRPRGVTAGAIVRAQPVTETSLMESGTYIVTNYLGNPSLILATPVFVQTMYLYLERYTIPFSGWFHH